MPFRPFIQIRKFLHLSYLILIILVALTVSFSFMVEKNIQNAGKDNLHQAGQQIISQIENTLTRSDSIIRNLASSQLLLEFLETPYTPGADFPYYNSEIRNFVNTCVGVDFHSSVNIYMSNSSIPEGYGYFYQLENADLDPDIRQFIDSSSNADIIYSNHTLVELKKLYSISGSFLGVAVIRLPEDSLWNSSIRQILNFDHTLLFNLSEETVLEDSSESLHASNLLFDEWNPDSIPMTLYFSDDVPSIYFTSHFFLFAAIGLIVLCMIAFYYQQQTGFRKTKYYLSQMELSLEQNMELRFDEESNDEFSYISRYINNLLDKISSLITKTVEQETAQKETQIQILQNQINPHFIYNTMEIFSSQMELYGHYEESDAMTSFASMLRYNIRTSTHYAALKEELSQIRNYVILQKLRYPNITTEISVPAELLFMNVVRFILQPFAENSIQHGMPDADYPLHISFSAVPSDSDIVFLIQDNGTGITDEKIAELNARFSSQSAYNDSASSIGLNNINYRLRLFYGPGSCLKAGHSDSGGSSFTFRIPADTNLENGYFSRCDR